MMDRINKIFNHEKYQCNFSKIQEMETDREFCRHTLEHFLDVGRLSYIFMLEEGGTLDREVVYGAALLHDIGRYEEQEAGVPHHEGSREIAFEILPKCGFNDEEISLIGEAIYSHKDGEGTGLSNWLYRADKMSRNCFNCSVSDECYWPLDKKNEEINY